MVESDNLPLLAYWNIRGNAQPIRLLLHYTQTKYREKTYNFGQSEIDKAHWRSEKAEEGFDFPNLPYFIDGNVKLTQSLTILRYLAKKHNLYGRTEQERCRIDLLEQQLRDYRLEFIKVTNDRNFEKSRIVYMDSLPEKLCSLSKFLRDRRFFAGEFISYVDFMAYEFIDQHYYLDPKLFDDDIDGNNPYELKNLMDYLHRIESIPTINKYQHEMNYPRHPSGLLVKWYEAKFASTFHRSIIEKPIEEIKDEILQHP